MMYYNFMETLRKNEYFLARDLAGEIRKAPETPHYRTLPEEELFKRIHQIIYHLYKRHASCLNSQSSKNTLGTWYSRLGQERFHEGFPLEEVLQVFVLIRKRIMRCVAERMHPEEDWSVNGTSRLYWNVSLFFDAMVRAVTAGYKEKSAPGPDSGAR
jgi:hypothetical protein